MERRPEASLSLKELVGFNDRCSQNLWAEKPLQKPRQWVITNTEWGMARQSWD